MTASIPGRTGMAKMGDMDRNGEALRIKLISEDGVASVDFTGEQVADLIKALREAVLAVHKPFSFFHERYCEVCEYPDHSGGVPWPCPTARSVEAEPWT